MLMKLAGQFSGFRVGLAFIFWGPFGIFLFLGLFLFLCYFLWHWHYCQISFKFENLTKSPNLNIYDTLSLVKFYSSSNLTFKTTVYFWCDSHSTSISYCKVWGVRVGTQVSKREFHTRIEFYLGKKKLTFKRKSFGIKFINDNDPTSLGNVIWIYSTLLIYFL